jgi:hypothetical protein
MATDRQKYYFEEWQKQQQYHSKKASQFKQRNQILQTITVLGSLIVPILLGVTDLPVIVPTIVSVVVAIATALENINKYGENWVSFRRTSELLKREHRMYMTRADVYANANAFEVFVQRVENIISEQNETFVAANRASSQEATRLQPPTIPPTTAG